MEESLDQWRKFDERPELHITLNERALSQDVIVKMDIMLATVQEQLNECKVHGRLPLAEVKKVIMLAAVEAQLNECELQEWLLAEVKKVIMLAAV